MSDEKVVQRSLLEAAAYSVALRVSGQITAAGNGLDELGHAVDMAGRDELTRELGKVAELHRLASTRFAVIVRRLGEGS
jgi:hypothetical protein